MIWPLKCRRIYLEHGRNLRDRIGKGPLKIEEAINYTNQIAEGLQAAHEDGADIKFGKNVMVFDRLDSLFNSKIITHLLVYKDQTSQSNVGIVTLFLEFC